MQVFYRRAAVMAVVISCVLFVVPGRGSAQGLELPDIVASRAIVVDATTGNIVFDKDANTPGAMASLTKLFTAAVALETTPLDQRMVVSDYDLVGEASMGIAAGEVLTFQTLLNGMLLPSGNDAAMTIARNLGARTGDTDRQATQRFIDRANARLWTLGLRDTRLVNPHGLDVAGHYSTARDIAAITLYALNNEPAFASTIQTAEYEAEGHQVSNTNRLLGAYDGLIGGKTGVTDNAGYCLMQVAERDGRRIIVVLLGSTPDAWYTDAAALLDYGFATTAVPGAAPSYGQISFATAPGISVPVSQPVAGLAVTSAGQGTTLVSQTGILAMPRRSPWLWVITATALAPTSLLVLAQLQRGLRRGSRRPARRRYAPMVQSSSAQPVVYAQSVDWRARPERDAVSARWGTVAADVRFDETTEWRIPPARPARRREELPRYPVLLPSFSGD